MQKRATGVDKLLYKLPYLYLISNIKKKPEVSLIESMHDAGSSVVGK